MDSACESADIIGREFGVPITQRIGDRGIKNPQRLTMQESDRAVGKVALLRKPLQDYLGHGAGAGRAAHNNDTRICLAAQSFGDARNTFRSEDKP